VASRGRSGFIDLNKLREHGISQPGDSDIDIMTKVGKIYKKDYTYSLNVGMIT